MASTRMMMDGGRSSYKRTTKNQQIGKSTSQIDQEEKSFYERTKNLPAHIQALVKADEEKAKRNTKSSISTAIKKAEYEAKKQRAVESRQAQALKNAASSGMPAAAVAAAGAALGKIAANNATERENKRQQLQSLKNAIDTGTVTAAVAAKIAPKITGKPVEGYKEPGYLSKFDIEMQNSSLDNAIMFGGIPMEVGEIIAENRFKRQLDSNQKKYSVSDIRTYADLNNIDFLDAKNKFDLMNDSELDKILDVLSGNIKHRYSTNPAEQLLNTAREELIKLHIDGQEEGRREENKDNNTIYGEWYGKNLKPWCSMFVSWSANETGILDDIVFKEAGVENMAYAYNKDGRYEKIHKNGLTYEPKAGDLFFKKTQKVDDFGNPKFKENGEPDYQHHIGIVEAYDPKTGNIYTIEGNLNDQVNYAVRNVNDGEVYGFGVNGGTDFGVIPTYPWEAGYGGDDR